MTYTEATALINEFIVANGNNEITADVLRPILEAIVQAANDTTGDLDDLATTDKSTLVAAINELFGIVDAFENSGVQLYSGLANPNITPPASYSIADFYIQVDGSNNPVQLYQWNGIVWTADGVDNNDFIPLDGTNPGNPVTGQVEFSDSSILLNNTSNNNTTTIESNTVTVENSIEGVSAGLNKDRVVVANSLGSSSILLGNELVISNISGDSVFMNHDDGFVSGNSSGKQSQLLYDCLRLSTNGNGFSAKIANDNTTSNLQIYQLPDKPDGEYTLATTDDITGAGVNSVSGTANQIEVDNSDPANPEISLSDDVNIVGNVDVGNNINAGNNITAVGTVAGSNLSGNNTGDQTSIVGISGTKAQFDSACSDGNFLFSGDVTQYTDAMARAAAVADNLTAASDVAPSKNAVNTALASKEDTANKSTSTSLGTSNTLFPTQNAVKVYADAKVQNNLLASTTIAPSATAVNTALAGYAKVIHKSAVDGTASSGTSETVSQTILIPANTFAAGDQWSVNAPFTKSGTAGTGTYRIRINTTNTTVGSTVIATNTPANTILRAGIWRIFNIRPGNVLEGVNFTLSAASENGSMASADNTTTYDPTADLYVFLTTQMANAGDSGNTSGSTFIRY